ncbi:reverse transcriptase family protein [Achromobacter xylosoxidans]|uniref:reverse transcriptase family protein n=1 Tax=Alcaligenes xylosoxydans xylosoxydans TaxID=85698 RepID=UPI000D7125EA|nr:reverse transcriptase family protein [Achromobacter xylosoxidans]PWV41096.1 hypothetical protein DDK21_11860 [Achromobacter xylosoxidans]
MNRITFASRPIASKAALAKTLSLDERVLTELEQNAGAYYLFFERPKKHGVGMRSITAPKPALMQVQRRINTRIFSGCKFPRYLHGSIKDVESPRDFLTNASEHRAAEHVITLDIKNFYPSIGREDVFKIFKYLLKFPDVVANSLTSLVTLNGAVPQGAPTSSFVANMVFYDREPKLVEEYNRSGVRYTRLLDDITLSFSNRISSEKFKGEVIGKVRAMCSEKGFKLHDGKQKIHALISSPNPAIVTGVSIRNGKMGLPPAYRDKTRAKVHNCVKQYGAGYQTSAEFHRLHNSALGDVTLLKRLNYSCADAYAEKLRSCLPTYSPKKARQLRRMCEDLAMKMRPSSVAGLTRRFHVLMHSLTVLARTRPSQARALRTLLRTSHAKAMSNG